MNEGTQGTFLVGALAVPGGTVHGIVAPAAVNVTPPSLTTGTTGNVAVTVAGVNPGDIVYAEPPTNLEAGLVFIGCRVTAANTVTLMFYNPSAGTVTGTAKSWNIGAVRLS